MNGATKRIDFSNLLVNSIKELPPGEYTGQLSNDITRLENVEPVSTITSETSDEDDEMTLNEIYKQLYTYEDIILIVDRCDEQKIRKGLSAIKAKETAKFKDSGVPHDNMTLEFKVHPQMEGMTKEQIKLQIFFVKKGKVKVYKTILPSEGL